MTLDTMKEHGMLCCLLPTIVYLLLPDLPITGASTDCVKIENCQENHNGSSLKFKYPNVQLDISVLRGKYMDPSMLCKAEGFTSITWLKDDRIEFPFGFMPGSSKCYTSLKKCNQTVEITNTQKEAIGNYTCLVSNGEETIQRTFHVYVEGMW
eukprot:XP_011663825.1 PREDICTED: uncharacterized protein LOC105438134 [Strongylocentrotus purpuratus]